MDVEPFGLERQLAEYERGADVTLAESGVLAPGGLFGFPGDFRIGVGLPNAELDEGSAGSAASSTGNAPDASRRRVSKPFILRPR
ncbi:hypothetical protein ACFQJD_13215 [Haloplanus sp. GCM10025708]|uniref:hypothetical protein n=1 Tax=Haloplanus sp. GCM10025708 TaxID=3252679 RepID=UPI00360A4EF3